MVAHREADDLNPLVERPDLPDELNARIVFQRDVDNDKIGNQTPDHHKGRLRILRAPAGRHIGFRVDRRRQTTAHEFMVIHNEYPNRHTLKKRKQWKPGWSAMPERPAGTR